MAFQKSCRYALLILFLWPLNSFADDLIASRFTSSMTMMYTSSEACRGTLAPGPDEYVKLITDYLNILYPSGIAYWVIPEVPQHVKDRRSCLVVVQQHLLEYQQASLDYQHNYPNQLPPPILVAYNWGDSRSMDLSSPVTQSPVDIPVETKSPWTSGRL